MPLRPNVTRISIASPDATLTVSPDSAHPALTVPASMAGSHRSRTSPGAETNAAADSTQPNHVDEFCARPSSSAITVVSTGRHPVPPSFSSTSKPVQSIAASSSRESCATLPVRNSRAASRNRSRSTSAESSSAIPRLAPAQQVFGVISHDPLLSGVVKRIQQLDEVSGFGQTLGVGVVRAHHETVVVTHGCNDRWDVVLGIRHHPNVLSEDRRGPLCEFPADPWTIAAHTSTLVHVLGEERHPFGTVFGNKHIQPREAPEQVVEDER